MNTIEFGDFKIRVPKSLQVSFYTWYLDATEIHSQQRSHLDGLVLLTAMVISHISLLRWGGGINAPLRHLPLQDQPSAFWPSKGFR